MNSIDELRTLKKKTANYNKQENRPRVSPKYLWILCLTLCLSGETGLLFAKEAPPKPKYTEEQIRKKREVLSKVLKYGTTKERATAIRELEDFPKEEAGELYDQVGSILAKDPDWSMRIYALRISGILSLTQFEDKIIALLKYDQQDVQKEAVYVVKKLKLSSGISTMTELLKAQDFTKNSNFLIALIDALGEFPEAHDAFSVLEARFQEKFNDPEVRAQIALYFGKVKNSSIENVLITTVKDEKEPITIRAYSVNALGKIKSTAAIAPLRELLDKIRNLKSKNDIQDYQALKIHTITALVSLGDKDIIEELYSFARDDDATVRLRAIKHLAETEDPAVIEILEYKAQRDPSEKVKRAAQAALDQLRKKLDPTYTPPTVEQKETSKTGPRRTGGSRRSRPSSGGDGSSPVPLSGGSNSSPSGGGAPSGDGPGGGSPPSGGGGGGGKPPESEDLESE
ncbi:HEAT repeat domain-containing protein [Leptospira langatensis]|uniref:HEAT repeat domain-containing protein n=1 Tax=Leptospira langatensis TaxID=2484983 RepID=A0A5F1ZPL7_9LEPT|nr:HEAT repeat domain-containing protein [Leptospira langatensis]TGK05511.1 HEAT repeat domain-containing protein [Leptospira langatensis]TGL38647.1 HEAT repeat domain-containing protein [Leptospira langatensis]